MRFTVVASSLLALCVLSMTGCGGGGDSAPASTPGASTLVPAPALTAFPDSLPAAGNSGACLVPPEAQLASISSPTTVVGNGTVGSCTSAAVVQAVANGGVITFNCGAAPVTITMAATAKVFNNKPDVVLDGGGKVTLSGGGVRRILYQNTCDQNQVWTSSRCDLQASPTLTLQRITLVDGDATGQNEGRTDVSGGGALFVRGGQVRIINSRFFSNTTELTGPDLGGGAVRLFGTQQALVVGSTFGGNASNGNTSSNGGAISTLGASLGIYNTEVSHNQALGRGQNPALPGTPGGGSGGAIYQDGNTFDLTVCGATVHDNLAIEGGSAVIYVSNNSTGTISITDSTFSAHPFGTFETPNLPGFFVKAASGQPVITRSTIVR
jgi:hypothetical protein